MTWAFLLAALTGEAYELGGTAGLLVWALMLLTYVIGRIAEYCRVGGTADLEHEVDRLHHQQGPNVDADWHLR